MSHLTETARLVAMVLAMGVMNQPKAHRRAATPKSFDKATSSVFMENAFDSLRGQRPGFEKKEKKREEVVQEEERGSGDFDRSDMMVKLETAENAVAEGLADQKTFGAATHRISGGADIMIMMGKTLFSNDPEYGQDDDYLKSAEDLMTSAKQVKTLTQKGDYEGARRAFSNAQKSCNSCHQKFRL
jgi:cytochrome c556